LRVGLGGQGVARVVVPSVLVIGTIAVLSPDITWKQAALITSLTEWNWSEPRWSYWFVEALVLSTLLLAALLAVPAVDRASRRWPFALPVALTVALTPFRFDLFGIPGDHVHRLNGMLWLVTLGWAISQARTTWRRHSSAYSPRRRCGSISSTGASTPSSRCPHRCSRPRSRSSSELSPP